MHQTLSFMGKRYNSAILWSSGKLRLEQSRDWYLQRMSFRSFRTSAAKSDVYLRQADRKFPVE